MSNAFRGTSVLAALLVFIACVQVISVGADEKIKIFVGTVPAVVSNGFIEPVPEGLRDSVTDIRQWLVRTRSLGRISVVASPEQADIVLHVMTREQSHETVGAMAAPIGNTVVAAPLKQRTAEVRARMAVGEFERPVNGVGRTWSDAALDVVRNLAEWLKSNREQVIAKRAERK